MCRAAGQPEPELHWSLNGVDIGAHDSRFHITIDGQLRVLNADDSTAGSYECRAENSAGVTYSRRARLTIDHPLMMSDEGSAAGTEAVLSLQRPQIVQRPLGGKWSARHPLVLHCLAHGKRQTDLQITRMSADLPPETRMRYPTHRSPRAAHQMDAQQ